MLSNEELVKLIQDQTSVNQKMLDALEAIKENTRETTQSLAGMNTTMTIVVTKYQHFSDLMKMNLTLMGAILFALVGIAIKM